MREMSILFLGSGTVAILILAVPSLAHAYLDPGSGSMLLQLLLGGLAFSAVVLKIYWRRFVAFFGLGRNKKNESEPTDSDQ